jgi:multiple sugar transport system ATP-binding protein
MGRAIVRDPTAFLMDEPLSNLDAKLRTQMRTELARIQNQLGTTTVYVTHDQIEAMTLGDRVAVMRGGVLQQVASPRELYEKPANLFVAGFMGSPAINLLTARVDGETLRSPLGDVPLDDRLRAALGQLERPETVIVGLRPEYLVDAAVTDRAGSGSGSGSITFTGEVNVLESMGAEYYAYFDLPEQAAETEITGAANDGDGTPAGLRNGAQLIARLGIDSDVAEHRQITLRFDPRRLHVFDPETGRRLTDTAS